MNLLPGGSEQRRFKLSPIESNILNYVLNFHAFQTHGKRSAFLALLIHSNFISKGATLADTENAETPLSSESILPEDWAAGDLIRLNYRLLDTHSNPVTTSNPAPEENWLQLSVAATDDHVYISLTDNKTDKFAHVEFLGSEHVNVKEIDCSNTSNSRNQVPPKPPLKASALFPQLESTLGEIDEKLLKPVVPTPVSKPSTEQNTNIRSNLLVDTRRMDPGLYGQRNIPISAEPIFPDYGRSDLDPISSMRGGGIGGMLLDPNRMPGMSGNRFIDPFVPPSSVPPGARYDPIGPQVGPGRSRNFRPDPDHAMPPGFDDMYL